jgi:hypothetical protein
MQRSTTMTKDVIFIARETGVVEPLDPSVGVVHDPSVKA